MPESQFVSRIKFFLGRQYAKHFLTHCFRFQPLKRTCCSEQTFFKKILTIKLPLFTKPETTRKYDRRQKTIAKSCWWRTHGRRNDYFRQRLQNFWQGEKRKKNHKPLTTFEKRINSLDREEGEGRRSHNEHSLGIGTRSNNKMTKSKYWTELDKTRYCFITQAIQQTFYTEKEQMKFAVFFRQNNQVGNHRGLPGEIFWSWFQHPTLYI